MRRFSNSLVAVLLVSVGAGMSAPAHAQRVLTDYEASKLTFDALTAPPVFHHHATFFHHHSRHASSASRMRFAQADNAHVTLVSARMHGKSTHTHSSHQAMVHNVVYHPKAAHGHRRHRG
ncbi:hypothetical protein [Acidomonas methanolica]|uniref:hypothetical protein n=1 Tax=Acidomonas methanolica TaxID=437 RepID=UPI00211A3CA5|nr:hypothetical protein [Acidomonas methanolica]MCQ9154402.1 hypothetical protein [Acidomonas methanolica]